MRSSSSARLAGSIVTSLALIGGWAGIATAQSDEVFVDPDSPAGKEYALPLDSARRDAAGGGGHAAPGGNAPPLFGAGISRGDTGQEGRRGNSGPAGKTSSDGGGGNAPGRAGDADGGGAETSEAVAHAVAESAGGLSAGMLTTLIALGVLLVGLVVGLSLRFLRDTNHAG